MRTSKITTEEIREIAKKLPKPISIYHSHETKFIIYKAKKLYKNKWLDRNLKKLVLESRRTYLRYGSRELLDMYDGKAVIYLIQVLYDTPYKNKKYATREWFSCRMSPGDAKPVGGGELEIYFHNGKSLDEVVKEKFFKKSNNFWKHIVSHSRMCGISPQFLSADIAPFVLDSKHRFTPHCFALVHRAFQEDYGHKNYKYYTGIIRDDFVRLGLTLKIGNKIYGPAFQSAFQTLGIPKDKIITNRQIYAYAFPLYWLNLEDIRKLIEEEIKIKNLSLESIHRYLDTHLPLQSIFSSKFNAALSRLGNLFTVNGKIKGGRITGVELRKMIDKRVKDAPELKISEIERWNNNTDNFLKMTNISKVK